MDIYTMGTFNFPISVAHRQLFRAGNKRIMIVIVLSIILAMLGSITLATSEFLHKASSHVTTKTSITRHAAVQTQTLIPVQKPTPSPTRPPKHVPVLGYPLFNGNTHLPEIALTFDDGPNPFYTPQILAILQRYGVKATFFDVGYLVVDYPSIVRQEYNQGNIVANHSWSHPQLTLLSAPAILSQITSASHAIQAAIGARPTFFRPPYGAMNRTVLAEARYAGDTTVLWDDTAEDWRLPGVAFIVSKILRLARDGAIILMHDGGGNRAQTVAALPIIITALKNRGFHFATMPQLVEDLVVPPSQSAYSNILSGTKISLTSTTELLAWKRKIYK
jgi:peptidoglycan/xylan/chitin deacetylase (PgdA/CDA1 family)